MNNQLSDWERASYVEGGGTPFLFYVVYGEVMTSAPLSRGRYRSNGPPQGIKVMSYGPHSQPDVPNRFRDGYVWDEFVASDPECSARVAAAQHCIVLRGEPHDSTTLNYLRDVVGLISWMLDQGGCCVYDPQILRWWNPSEWKQHIFDPAAPVPSQHAVILVSDEPVASRQWYHTRGMRKFGRPDISIHNVARENADGVIDLCNRLIEHQAFGLVVPEGKSIQMESLPQGGVCRHAGCLDDPDFNNVHIEVRWESPSRS